MLLLTNISPAVFGDVLLFMLPLMAVMLLLLLLVFALLLLLLLMLADDYLLCCNLAFLFVFAYKYVATHYKPSNKSERREQQQQQQATQLHFQWLWG